MHTINLNTVLFLFLCTVFFNSGCNSPSQAPGTDTYADARSRCVDSINSWRSGIGLPPLVRWTEKDACTDNQARQDSESGTAHGAFGQCGERAQNECPGYGSINSISSGCLVSMWNEGPGEPYSQHGHYINMTNSAYTRISVGFYTMASGRVWAVFNFYP